MKRIDVVIGLICRDGKVLVCQRRAKDPLGGYWEFPGGKQEPGETLEQCLHRELIEELAIRVRIIQRLETVEFEYANAHVRLHPFVCAFLEGDPMPLAAQQLAWATSADLPRFTFPPANAPLLRWLECHLATPV